MGGSHAWLSKRRSCVNPQRERYASFAELAQSCDQFCEVVNGRVHRETCAVPAQRLEAERARLHRLEAERARLHRLPDAPHTAALGTTRVVNTDQTIRFGSGVISRTAHRARFSEELRPEHPPFAAKVLS